MDKSSGSIALAIITVVKPADGDDVMRIRQENALRSWKMAFPAAELFVAGDSSVAASVGAADLVAARTPTGTYLLDSLLEGVRAATDTRIIAYANADVVVTRGLRVAVEQTCREADAPFLVVGQRFEVPLAGTALPFEDAERTAQALAEAERAPGAHLKDGMNKDYFVFSRDAWPPGTLPAIAVGRAEVDNYLVQDAVARGLWVVDVTPVQRAYHQTHSYAHLSGGKFQAYEGAEALANREIMRARFGHKVRPLAHVYNAPRRMLCVTPPARGGDEARGMGPGPNCAQEGWALRTERVWVNEVGRHLYYAGVFNLWVLWIAALVTGVVVWGAWAFATRRVRRT